MSLATWNLAWIDVAAARECAARDAFGDAVRPLEPGLATLVWRLLGWPAQAAEIEDVVQDVLLTAWNQRAHLREPAAFPGWIRRIAINTARNHSRTLRRRLRRVEPRSFGPGEEPSAATTDPVDDAVRDALARLRHRDREILVLHYLESSPIEDLATLLGLRRNAVEARLSRARKHMRSLLTEAPDGR